MSLSAQHNNNILPIVGAAMSAETASATSVFGVVNAVNTSMPNYGPYGIWNDCSWQGTQSVVGPLQPGSVVVFRSNNWPTKGACGQPTIGSIDYKGYLHQPNPSVVLTQGSAVSKGGNSLQKEPLPMLVQSCENRTPIVVPEISAASGDGGVSMTVTGFVSLLLTEAPCSNYGPPASIDFTGTVVNFAPYSSELGVCSTLSCLNNSDTSAATVVLLME